MRMDAITRLMQRKMEDEVQKEAAHALAPMVFYITTGEGMAGWIGPRQELFAERMQDMGVPTYDEEELSRLKNCDGVILQQDCGAVGSEVDRQYLFRKIIPTVVKAMEIQAVVFGMSMHRFITEVPTDQVEDQTEAEAYVQGLVAEMGMDAIMAEAEESLVLMVCDREVRYTLTAQVERDDEGIVQEVYPWQDRSIENEPDGFLDQAQKALRSV